MLTDEQKFENKKRYLELLTKLGIDLTQILKYLESVDYFEQPATPAYHRAYAGGLCEQALLIYNELSQLVNAYYPNGPYTEKDVIIVACFLELYRAEMYELYTKNTKNESTGTWETTYAYRLKEVRPTFGDVGFSSYMITKYFIPLSDEQIEAFCLVSKVNIEGNDIHDILKSYPLVTLTRMAVLVVNYLL